jgi:hypothetical protein
MKSDELLVRQLEELRRRLHEEIGSRYDPLRVQALAPISREFDRLALELIRRSMVPLQGNG